MTKFMDSKWGKRIDDAVAFEMNFDYMIFGYGDRCPLDYIVYLCNKCGKYVQHKDYEAPRSSCKKEYGILDVLNFGVNEALRNELIENFDITEEDFRPVKNKSGDIVFYQITPQHIMPAISEVNPWKALKPCKKCGRIQYRSKGMYNEKDEEYYYITQNALDGMKDLNYSFEQFEEYSRLVVVSRRMYDFLSEKYPRMKFRPFFLKEEN